MMATLAVAATVLVAVAAVSALAAMSNSKSIQNYGAVKTANVGVYWDGGCTNATSIVQWGSLSPGTSSSVVLYVRNEGNVALRLALTTSNWSSVAASSYMTLGWNRQGHLLNAGSSIQATLTLSVSSSITGVSSFSFDIIISGTEQ
jgi:hypothetical protein